jgi:hypothetical protein
MGRCRPFAGPPRSTIAPAKIVLAEYRVGGGIRVQRIVVAEHAVVLPIGHVQIAECVEGDADAVEQVVRRGWPERIARTVVVFGPLGEIAELPQDEIGEGFVACWRSIMQDAAVAGVTDPYAVGAGEHPAGKEQAVGQGVARAVVAQAEVGPVAVEIALADDQVGLPVEAGGVVETQHAVVEGVRDPEIPGGVHVHALG